MLTTHTAGYITFSCEQHVLTLFWLPGFSFEDCHVLFPILLSILPFLFWNYQKNHNALSICLFSCGFASIICLRSWINRHCLTNLLRQMLLSRIIWRQTFLLFVIYCQTKAMIYTIWNCSLKSSSCSHFKWQIDFGEISLDIIGSWKSWSSLV